MLGRAENIRFRSIFMRAMNTVISQSGKFTDCDEWCEAVAGWNLQFQQLDRGPLNAVMNRALMPELAVQHVGLSRRFHQSGDPPDGLLTFGVPGDHRLIQWFDRGRSQSGIMNFNRSNGFDCVSEPGFSAYTFSVAAAAFVEDCHALGATDSHIELLEHQGMVALPDQECIRLINLSAILMQRTTNGATGNEGVHELASDVSYLLALALIGSDQTGGLRARALRQRAVDKALEAIHASDGLASVPDICRHSAASARSLSRGFQERFGVSTKQYMVGTRLSAARRALSGGKTSVTEAASQYGFWHLGRFSADYKAMFGELPSVTLAASAMKQAV